MVQGPATTAETMESFNDLLGFCQAFKISRDAAVFGGIGKFKAAQFSFIFKRHPGGYAHTVLRKFEFIAHGFNIHEQIFLHDNDIRSVALISRHPGLSQKFWDPAETP